MEKNRIIPMMPVNNIGNLGENLNRAYKIQSLLEATYQLGNQILYHSKPKVESDLEYLEVHKKVVSYNADISIILRNSWNILFERANILEYLMIYHRIKKINESLIGIIQEYQLDIPYDGHIIAMRKFISTIMGIKAEMTVVI